MKQIRLTLKELETKTIPIGREGENDYTVVTIDCAEVFEKHPNAAATMRAQNYRKQIYPVTIVRDGNDIVWTVKDSDLTVKGDGRIQLTFTEGTIIHKTVIGRTLVLKSLITDGPAPDPVQDWLDEAEDALEDLVSAEVHQPIIGEDGFWYKWNQEDGEYQKTNTKAQGEDGQDGHTPEKGVDYWTAADKSEMESDVAGAIIDDTSTGLDKTWSASKSNTLLSDLTAKPTIKDSLKTGVDFDLSDPDGNVVARLYDGHIKTKKFDSAVIDEWYGADYVSHGDSITWQDGKAYVQGEHTGEIARGYQTVLKEKLGIDQYTNYGKSGWSMAVVNSNGVVNTIIGVSSYAGIDLCTIACGTNDFKLNVSIGSIGQIGDLTFDDTTFYGAFRKAIEYILTSNPTIRLVLMTPLQRDNSGYDVNTTNSAGHKLIDYVDAVKALGQMYGLPVCDMFANSGFTKKTLDTYTMDGLHPNDVGYQRMGDYLTHFIMNVGK